MRRDLANPGALPSAPRRVLLAGVVATMLPRPLWSAAPNLATAIRGFTAGALPRAGKVMLEVAPLVENGNTVPITVSVDSPMTGANHVTAIAVFNERNPQRDVIRVQLGPRSGRAQLSTRIRLATSQQLVAVAKMSDGSFWSHSVDVVVTLAACIE